MDDFWHKTQTNVVYEIQKKLKKLKIGACVIIIRQFFSLFLPRKCQNSNRLNLSQGYAHFVKET